MSSTQTPEILELLSEIEMRERDTKGAAQTSEQCDSPLDDPRGYLVLNATGHNVGAVQDLYVDPHTREPHYALLNLGQHLLGVGNRKVLVNYEDLEVTADREIQVRTAAV